MTCPGDVELSRALSLGAGPELAAHLDACSTCRAAWDGARNAIDLARELSVALPPPARREEVRTAVLAAAAGRAHRPARRAWLVPAIAGAAAAGVAGYLAISHPVSPPAAPPPHAHGVVRPHPGARYFLGSIGPDEIVRLGDGVIDVEVEPLHPGERFRVLVGAAELEVRGTAFTVTARDERLVEVAVARGRVDLTSAAVSASLTAGQSWHAAVAVSPPPPPQSPPVHAPPPRPHRVAAAPHHGAESPPAVPAPVPPPAPAPVPPPPARSSAEVSYDDAWMALRTGDFPHAASGFARVVLLAPDSPLAEDASFWRAVALARDKRKPEAISAFHDFLDGYARSARAGEASAMLGWLLVDTHAYDEAARRFAAATGDASAEVRGSAQAGLDALARRKR